MSRLRQFLLLQLLLLTTLVAGEYTQILPIEVVSATGPTLVVNVGLADENREVGGFGEFV
jgi:hypothetical protein